VSEPVSPVPVGSGGAADRSAVFGHWVSVTDGSERQHVGTFARFPHICPGETCAIGWWLTAQLARRCFNGLAQHGPKGEYERARCTEA
jgi:hypothetical protein